MKVLKGEERRQNRVRLAFRLQNKHDINPSQIAEVLGLSEKSYQDRIRKLQLEVEVSKPLSATERALERLKVELHKLIDGDELPDKSKAEALMALARAVKTVGELASEASPDLTDDANVTISLAEVRQVMMRIDRRIDEVAKKRAREIMGGGLDAKADTGSRKRMADQSA